MSLKISHLVLTILVMWAIVARGQEAISSITQARLFTNQTAPGTTSVDGNGTALPEEEPTSGSGDDSFGAQIILKNQERPKKFSVFTEISASHTNNVDLTPDHGRSDSFLAARAGGAWRPIQTSEFIGEISTGTSFFRYDRARELDFETINAGADLSWLVPRLQCSFCLVATISRKCWTRAAVNCSRTTLSA